MENAFFYTFSTIAQSLAALIAMLGAFALFRIQAIDNELRMRADKFGNTFCIVVDDHIKIQNLIADGMYAEFIIAVDDYLLNGSHKTIFDFLAKASFNRMKKLVLNRKSIVNYSWWAFGSSALIILASICILGITPLVYEAKWLLVIGDAVFFLCVILQFVLIHRILKQ